MGEEFQEVNDMNGYVSPRLGVRFETADDALLISHPDGKPFQTFQQIVDRAMAVERELDRMRALLRAAGIDPDEPT